MELNERGIKRKRLLNAKTTTTDQKRFQKRKRRKSGKILGEMQTYGRSRPISRLQGFRGETCARSSLFGSLAKVGGAFAYILHLCLSSLLLCGERTASELRSQNSPKFPILFRFLLDFVLIRPPLRSHESNPFSALTRLSHKAISERGADNTYFFPSSPRFTPPFTAPFINRR